MPISREMSIGTPMNDPLKEINHAKLPLESIFLPQVLA